MRKRVQAHLSDPYIVQDDRNLGVLLDLRLKCDEDTSEGVGSRGGGRKGFWRRGREGMGMKGVGRGAERGLGGKEVGGRMERGWEEG